MKTIPELESEGKRIGSEAKSFLSPEFGCLELPVLLSEIALNTGKGRLAAHYTLVSAIAANIGRILTENIPAYLSLHARLVEKGYTLQNWGETGSCDRYGCAVADIAAAPRTSREWCDKEEDLTKVLIDELKAEKALPSGPPDIAVKAMAFRNQSYNFIVVLNSRFNRWSIHIRQYWDVLPDLDGETYLGYGLDKFKTAPMSLTEAISLSKALSRYSDDVPGTQFINRPSLATFTNGTLKAGEQSGGRGLRYADGRDAGYLVSCRETKDDVELAEDVDWNSLNLLFGVLAEIEGVCFSTSEDTDD